MSKKILVIALILFIIFSYILYNLLNTDYTNETKKRIEQSLYFDKAIQTYIAKYQKPAINKLKAADKNYKDFFDPILMSSTFISRHIIQEYKKNLQNSKYNYDDNVVFKVASDNPTNPVNKANQFETKVLAKFNKQNLSEYSEIVDYNGQKTQFFAMPVARNTKDCLECHGNPKEASSKCKEMYGNFNGFYEKEGHIRALIAIYSPIEKDRANMMKLFYTIDAIVFAILLLSLLSFAYFGRKKN